ncbi:bifunctional protein-disulfide isomerase/oxidoreductase DsbC [Gallaecimonas mangrovi]|uniref:bifunctional protein-disulfide isomerase/oxidoreductase DsbC n=1 Tax=Gallaecimonas mangrovi TaxID=2291597 RepID=UPI000E1FBE76|nr:bifunctional protein-disulfide isomerase/oxidoreductase DsbC [Gallaecimonas mangrovi]
MHRVKMGLAALALVSLLAQGSEADIKTRLEAKLGVTVDSIQPSPVPGLYEVVASNNILYASADGQYLFSGSLYSLKGDEPQSLTDQQLGKVRLAALKPYEASMIVFKAPEQKHVVTVFTDTDCGYCQRLHAHMQQYNDLGITIRYLAFPRGGLQSAAAAELEAVWCAKDQQQAMNLAKHRKNLPKASCINDPVAQHYQLGRSFNVSGTPALILDDGTMINGYLPPERLASALESH